MGATKDKNTSLVHYTTKLTQLLPLSFISIGAIFLGHFCISSSPSLAYPIQFVSFLPAPLPVALGSPSWPSSSLSLYSFNAVIVSFDTAALTADLFDPLVEGVELEISSRDGGRSAIFAASTV